MARDTIPFLGIMIRYLLISLMFIGTTALKGQTNTWENTVLSFIKEYQDLSIEPLRLAYAENIKGIKSPDSLLLQRNLFNDLQEDLKATNRDLLEVIQQLEYDFLEYLVKLHEERIALELKWHEKPVFPISDSVILDLPNGKEWYVYFLRRWLDLTIDVEDLYQFGLSEIQKAKANIREIQRRSGKDSTAFHQYLKGEQFLLRNADSVQFYFESYADKIYPKLTTFFPQIEIIPEVKIKRGIDESLSQVPGYYREGTFYYNIFTKPFNKRQIAFLYLHEALPGHHYEVSHRNLVTSLPLQAIYRNSGYGEGWAAYIEELAYDIDLYPDIYGKLGRLEWDLIRSVRVVLDIALNYHGWTDERALAFWRQHLSDKDDIGRREIARMKRWPCQVITYKYGADRILEWKSILEKEPGFNLIEFHKRILEVGPLPYSILENRLLIK